MKQIRVPRHWNGDQALVTVAFLENIIAAIWRQHGPEMAQCLKSDCFYSKARRPPRPRPIQPSLPLVP
jgi:hypothetical protein